METSALDWKFSYRRARKLMVGITGLTQDTERQLQPSQQAPASPLHSLRVAYAMMETNGIMRPSNARNLKTHSFLWQTHPTTLTSGPTISSAKYSSTSNPRVNMGA